VLHARLSAVDPAAAQKLHPNDVRRLVRALEVLELTGRPISAWQQQFDQVRPRRHAPLWLDLPRSVLYARIDRRVDQMMEQGLLDEVKRLVSLPRQLSKEARQALGYKELLDYLEGKTSLPEAITAIQTRSRNFAKRQLSWFRHLPECRALALAATETTEQIAGRVLATWFPA
jgi:tRNA dimethylallyltransferase